MPLHQFVVGLSAMERTVQRKSGSKTRFHKGDLSLGSDGLNARIAHDLRIRASGCGPEGRTCTPVVVQIEGVEDRDGGIPQASGCCRWLRRGRQAALTGLPESFATSIRLWLDMTYGRFTVTHAGAVGERVVQWLLPLSPLLVTLIVTCVAFLGTVSGMVTF